MASSLEAAACGVCASLAGPDRPLFENELWQVRHTAPPHSLPGWLLLISRRHVPGPAHFDDREAASLGPTLRHLQRTLISISGALRVYMAALGESWPHFHCHLVPRYASMPKDAKGWSVFDLQRAAAAGEVAVDALEVERLSAAYRDALSANPPPPP